MTDLKIASKGKMYTVQVDDEDYPLLSRHKWYILFAGPNKRPYAFTRFYTDHDAKNGKTLLMHHLIMGTSRAVDHINSDSLNNQKSNLRVATRSQNGANMRKTKKKTSSQYKGVCFAKLAGKFRATITCNHVTHQLGSYDNEHDAAKAYNKKARELFGEYALLNKINHSPTFNG